MGITTLLRIALSILLLMLAILAFSIGEQRGSFSGDRLVSSVAFKPLRSLEIRSRIADGSTAAPSQIDEPTVNELALRAPLDPIPFEIKASQALTDIDDPALELYARLALQRQPRSLTARLARFSDAANRADTESVLVEYSRLNRLGMIDRVTLADALIGYFREIRNWDPLLTFLQKRPVSGKLILIKLFQEDLEPALLNDVVQLYPDTQSSFLTSLLREEQFSDAHAAWLELYRGDKSQLAELPFNPSFQKRDASAPFNWSLESDLVEYRDGGGLDVVYFGTGRQHLLRQVIYAPAGRYSLDASVSGQMHPGAGTFELNIECLPSQATIGTISLQLEQVDLQTDFSAELSIPDHQCEFQRINLLGISGEFPQRSRALVRSIELTQLDSGAD